MGLFKKKLRKLNKNKCGWCGRVGDMVKEHEYSNIAGHKATSYRCLSCMAENIWAEDGIHVIVNGGDWEEVDPW